MLALTSNRVAQIFQNRIEAEDLAQQCWYGYLRYFDNVRDKLNTCFRFMFGYARQLLRKSFISEDEIDFNNYCILASSERMVDDTDELLGRKTNLEVILASLSLRDQIIVRLRMAGAEFESIGQLVGLTRERCRQIYENFAGN